MARWRLVVALVGAALAPAGLASPSSATAACASAVIVDGRVLYGGEFDHPGRLPDRGSLIASAAHPLPLALFGSRARPSYRERHPCRREDRTMRGAVVEDAAYGFELRRTDRKVRIDVDAGTRIANRPPYQPLLAGQRVALRTSICGPRRLADAIRFVGGTVRPPRSDVTTADDSSSGGVGLAAGVAGLLLVVAIGARRWASRHR